MVYKLKQSAAFRRELKKIRKRGYKMDSLDYIVTTLLNGQALPPKYRDHALTGNWKGYRECHVAPDWLLIYKIEADVLI